MEKSQSEPPRKPLKWMGDSLAMMSEFPAPVKATLGYALHKAQLGETSTSAKPLKGFGGAGVLEVVEDHRGDTYRAVYTVKFREIVFVLHVFQKKSKSGIRTPKHEIDLVRERLKDATDVYNELRGSR
jgi:phage-related protein